MLTLTIPIPPTANAWMGSRSGIAAISGATCLSVLAALLKEVVPVRIEHLVCGDLVFVDTETSAYVIAITDKSLNIDVALLAIHAAAQRIRRMSEMTDISELLLVEHVTPEIYEQLKPHVTALPETSTINVNTMSEVIFQSLAPDLDVSEFISQREDEPYDSVDEFIERLQIPVDTEGLSVDTRFFRAHGQVVQDEHTFQLTTLIYRNGEGEIRVINRTIGQY